MNAFVAADGSGLGNRRAFDRVAIWAMLAIALGSAVLIFARLGHYALWDDEALTAMTAKNVWRTGHRWLGFLATAIWFAGCRLRSWG
jgi:hypothetical protein